MRKYTFYLAVLAGLAIISTNRVFAAQACCAAPISTEASTAITPRTNQSVNAVTSATSATQVQKLEVTSAYSPSVLTVENNKPVVLQVHRNDDKSCGGELLIPAFGIHAEIPAGKTTEVKFTPPKAGTFAFTCGMQMMKGSLVVKESSSK